MNHLWTYIQSLGLSARNRKWLAQKLIEPSSETDITPELSEQITIAREEYRNGETISCATPEEMKRYFDSL